MMNGNLLERTGRGKYRITERGLDVLKSNPPSISTKFLMQFPEFIAFQNASRQGAKQAKELESLEAVESETPEEILETSYQSLRRNLAQEILERVKECSPRFFETLVVDLLVAMGYGGSRKDAGQAVGQSGDGGIDGIIKEDKLGLDAVYIQAKRWDNSTVGRPDLQKFVGSLAGRKARKGVFITTSQFSDEARKYVDGLEMKIVLIDGEELAQLMIDHGVAVTELATYVVKKIDLDYFGEE
jgi:restriction system protein